MCFVLLLQQYFHQNTKRRLVSCGVKISYYYCHHYFYHIIPYVPLHGQLIDYNTNHLILSICMIIMQAIQKSRPLNPRKSQHFLAFSCHHRERNIKQNVVHANNRAAAFFSSDMKGIRMKSTTSPTDISATPSGMSRPIYVAATQQHVGKTTTCLSLISGLKKRFPQSIGYIKPVGQQHVPVYSEKMGKEIRV